MTAAPSARSFRPRFRAVAGTVVLALAGAVLVQAGGATAATGTSLACDRNTVYGVASNGDLKSIALDSGTVTDVASFKTADGVYTAGNALGIAPGGTAAYAVEQKTGNEVLRFTPDASGGTVSAVGTAPSGSSNATHVIRGAVDPANGLFYAASQDTPSILSAFDPTTGQQRGVLGKIDGLSGTSGDIAFSTSGAMFLVAGGEVRRLVGSVPEQPATGDVPTLQTTLLTTLSATNASPGIAFSTNGYLYVASAPRTGTNASLYKIDPETGNQIGAALALSTGSNFLPLDLASCNYPNTVSATAALDQQVKSGDAFTVAITSGAGGTARGSATTGADGSPATAGPVPALPGTSYTVTQTPASGTTAADYTTTWSCTYRQGAGGTATVLSTGSGSSATFTFPTPTQSDPDGLDLTCAFTNTAITAPVRIITKLGGPRVRAGDQFVVGVQSGGSTVGAAASDTSQGTGSDVTTGTGDTGDVDVVVDRPYSLHQILTAAARDGQYTHSIACEDTGTGGTVLPASGAYTQDRTITPQPGAQIVCTITASPAPASIALATALGDDRYRDADQFTASVQDGGGTALGTPGTATTSGSGHAVDGGSTTFTAAVGGTAYTLIQTPTADASRYARVLACHDSSGFLDDSSTTFTGSSAITPAAGSKLVCTVNVTLAGAGLRVDTALTDPRFDDGDQFTAAIHRGPDASGDVLNDTGHSTTSGTGSDVTDGTTGLVALAHGTTVTITDDVNADATRYARTLTCVDTANTDTTGLPTGVAFTGAYTLVTQPGAALQCTVRAAAAPAQIVITAGLGSDRFADGDQFRVGLQDAHGAELGTASGETTTGTGDAIDGGTGTTGPVTAPRGATYAVTGAITADDVRYDRAITCSEGSGLTGQSLPSGAFTGSADLVPQAGAIIACTIRATLKAAALTATAALGSARFDDGDQWTPAWLAGDGAGAPLNDTTASTTQGTGDRIVGGTGTTGAITAVNAVAYTLRDPVTANRARYGTALTCHDANHLQQGLPDGAVFTDSTRIVPEAGADVRCVLSASILPAALALHLTGPAAAQVGSPAAWTALLTNDGGADADGAFTAQLPDGFTYRDVRGDGWSCSAADRVLSCSGPTIRGGGSTTAVVDLVPGAGSEGDAALRAAVDPTGAGAVTDPASCTGSGLPTAGCDVARTVVGGLPHLTVAIAPPAAAAVGATATWSITVRDDGTGPAGSAAVRLQLPDGVGTPVFSGADCTVSGRTASCALPGGLPAGGARTFTMTATPQPAAAGTVAVLRAAVDPAAGAPADPAACSDTDPATGCAVASTPVASGVALTVTVVPPAQLTEGLPAAYQVTVTNTGTATASAPVVSAHLPAGLQVVGTAGATCTGAGDLTCTLPAGLPAGAGSTFTVTVQPADGTAGTPLALAAAVAPAGGVPPAASGCTATGTPAGCAVAPPRTVQPVGRTLRITGRVLDAPAAGLVAGDRIRYAFTVVNTSGGPVDRIDLEVAGLGAAHCSATSLAAGASTTCVLGPVAVTQEQVDAGSVARDAVATAVPAGCSTACPAVRSNTVTPAAPVRTLTRLSAVQTAHLHDRNGDGVAQVGERVDFTVRVTNTGTVTLQDVRLTDGLVVLHCPRTVLAVGASMTCTGTRITTAADAAAGGMRSDATASAQGVRVRTTVSQRTTVTVAAAGRSAGLAHTGSNLTAGLAAGGLLLVLGGVLLLIGRRRRREA